MFDLTTVLPQIVTRKKVSSKASLSQVNLTILVLTAVFGFVYLFGINSLGTQGFEIRDLEKTISELEVEQKHLEVQASNLQSINRIQQEAGKLNFVPVGSVTYIRDSDFALK